MTFWKRQNYRDSICSQLTSLGIIPSLFELRGLGQTKVHISAQCLLSVCPGVGCISWPIFPTHKMGILSPHFIGLFLRIKWKWKMLFTVMIFLPFPVFCQFFQIFYVSITARNSLHALNPLLKVCKCVSWYSDFIHNYQIYKNDKRLSTHVK